MDDTLVETRTRTRSHVAPLRKKGRIPPLVHGEKMDADEFLRRYEVMDEDEKAELINGVVYMFNEFVSTQWHAAPDGLLQTWMGYYAVETPGVQNCPNATIQLGPKNVPQPDGVLVLAPELGGKASIDGRGFLVGPIELAVEIAASSAHFDLGEKRDAYRKSGVQEYLIWCTKKETIDWWHLQIGEYVRFEPDEQGIIRSLVFPGLWLDTKALLNRDGKKVMATLKKGLKSAEHKRFTKRVRSN
jgi:Uma2 family endonuclease